MRVGLFALFSALALMAAPASAQQGTVTIPSVGPNGVISLPAEAELRRTCGIADVGAFSNRVHVHCAQDRTVMGGLHTRDVPPPEPDQALSISRWARRATRP